MAWHVEFYRSTNVNSTGCPPQSKEIKVLFHCHTKLLSGPCPACAHQVNLHLLFSFQNDFSHMSPLVKQLQLLQDQIKHCLARPPAGIVMPNFTASGTCRYDCSLPRYYTHLPVSLLDMVFLTIFVLRIPLASGEAYGPLPRMF